MNELTCTPNFAKGCLLATELKVGTRVYPRGKIIGKDEISRLNETGIKSVNVIQIGIRDLLANPATDKLTQALAGHGLLAKPASLGHGQVKAGITGLLCYSTTALDEALANQDDFSIVARPHFSKVSNSDSCAEVTTHPIALKIVVGKAIAASMPAMKILQFSPLVVTCLLVATASTAPSPTVVAIQAALADYGSTLDIHLGNSIPATINSDLLVLAVNTGVPLNQAIVAVGAIPISQPKNQEPNAFWLGGMHDALPVIAIADALEQLPAQLLRLLDLVHAGQHLTAGADLLPTDHTTP